MKIVGTIKRFISFKRAGLVNTIWFHNLKAQSSVTLILISSLQRSVLVSPMKNPSKSIHWEESVSKYEAINLLDSGVIFQMDYSFLIFKFLSLFGCISTPTECSIMFALKLLWDSLRWRTIAHSISTINLVLYRHDKSCPLRQHSLWVNLLIKNGNFQ